MNDERSDEGLPYEGLRVVDLSQGVAGRHCGMLLALNGADVVKVEPPEGDWGRGLGRRYGDFSAYAMAFNRGKRSLALDLKHAEGRIPLHRIPGLPQPASGSAAARSPALGEHTREVLGELGLAPAEIAALEAAGTVRATPRAPDVSDTTVSVKAPRPVSPHPASSGPWL